MPEHDLRTLNILGAFCLSVSDQIQGAANDALGMAASFPAAIVQIGMFSAQLGNLQSALSLTQSAATRLVQKLEEQGLVVKEKSAVDSRQACLRLTDKGRSEMEKILTNRYSVLQAAVKTLTFDETSQLEKIISKILKFTIQDRQKSDMACRLCDLSSCPQDICPAEPCGIKLN